MKRFPGRTYFVAQPIWNSINRNRTSLMEVFYAFQDFRLQYLKLGQLCLAKAQKTLKKQISSSK
jgi:hypothetical protein